MTMNIRQQTGMGVIVLIFCKNRIEFMALPKDEKARVDEIDNCIADLVNAPDAEPERKTKIEMNWVTYFDDMGTPVIHIPYEYRCGNCSCQLQRTYDGIDVNYCPECGYRLEW